MKAVILAGGKGTRVASVRADIPKPMLPLDGKPILEHQILRLKENGIYDITLIVGHLGNCISEYFQDGHEFGVKLSYIWETEPLGTGGALYDLKDWAEDFFLINGDIVFDISFRKMWQFHQDKQAKITLLVHPNHHPYDSTLLAMDEQNRVIQWPAEWQHITRNCVNAGIHILSPMVLQSLTERTKRNLDRDIISPQIANGVVYAYQSPEYVRDMGTPERYAIVEQDMHSGIVAKKNLDKPQKAIFLDRDGTINRAAGYITCPEQLVLEDGAAEAIAKINQSEYLAIVITNQPVIARGDCTIEDLEQIHGQMERLLGEQGAYIDDLFYCPHHPDRGFPGEVLKYKIVCACRKPKPGMILKAAERYGIDLSQSYFIGDGDWDMQAAWAAGCQAIRLNNIEAGELKGSYKNLYDAVASIIGE